MCVKKCECEILATARANLRAFNDWQDECEKFIDDIYNQKITKEEALNKAEALKNDVSRMLVIDLRDCLIEKNR